MYEALSLSSPMASPMASPMDSPEQSPVGRDRPVAPHANAAHGPRKGPSRKLRLKFRLPATLEAEGASSQDNGGAPSGPASPRGSVEPPSAAQSRQARLARWGSHPSPAKCASPSGQRATRALGQRPPDTKSGRHFSPTLGVHAPWHLLPNSRSASPLVPSPGPPPHRSPARDSVVERMAERAGKATRYEA